MTEQSHEVNGVSAPSQPLADWLAAYYDQADALPADRHGPWAAAWDRLGLEAADQRQPPSAPESDRR